MRVVKTGVSILPQPWPKPITQASVRYRVRRYITVVFNVEVCLVLVRMYDRAPRCCCTVIVQSSQLRRSIEACSVLLPRLLLLIEITIDSCIWQRFVIALQWRHTFLIGRDYSPPS